MKLNNEILELIAQRFKAMSEPTRLKILYLLKSREMSVSEIAEQAELKHGTASANLNALHKAGLVASRREGTRMYYRLSSDMVVNVCDTVCGSIREEMDHMAQMRDTMQEAG